MKKTKIIIPAMGLLLLGTAASVTGTVAWFSINSKVTISGMKVNTHVGSNLLIAPDSSNNSSDSVYGNSLHENTLSATLEPVSTVNGKDFFYTSSSNVKGDGDAKTDTYIAYAADQAFDVNYGFPSDGTQDALGYLDYKFYLKATNGDNANRYLAMSTCNLIYEGDQLGASDLAWRVAVFAVETGTTVSKTDVETIGTDAANLVSILRRSGAQYFTTDSAVSATNAVSAVNAKIDDTVNIAELTPAQTKYYKVIVRLWLEGEDKKCTNETFASLTGKYDLDLGFEMRAATGVINITTNRNASIAASDKTATLTVTDGAISNGEIFSSVKWYNAASDAELSGAETTYTNAGAAIKVYCVVTTARGNQYRSNTVSLAAAA